CWFFSYVIARRGNGSQSRDRRNSSRPYGILHLMIFLICCRPFFNGLNDCRHLDDWIWAIFEGFSVRKTRGVVSCPFKRHFEIGSPSFNPRHAEVRASATRAKSPIIPWATAWWLP